MRTLSPPPPRSVFYATLRCQPSNRGTFRSSELRQAWAVALQREDCATHRVALAEATAVLARLNLALSASQLRDRLKKLRNTANDEKLSFAELGALVGVMKEEAALPEKELYDTYAL